jgi:hypothetical protein
VTATTTVPPEVQQYLNAVRAELRDLPEAERNDLLAEVESSLVETAKEGGAVSARLGPPEEFAAELRIAAGLHRPDAAAAAEPPMLARVAQALAALAARDDVSRAHRLARELAPIWWVVRGYLVVGLFALATDVGWSIKYPFVPAFGNNGADGALALTLAVAASVALGLYARRGAKPVAAISLVAGVLAVCAAYPVLHHVAGESNANANFRAAALGSQAVIEPPPGLAISGVPVTNLYPYSREGRLLHDVLIYDGRGVPVEIGANAHDPLRRVLRTPAGKPIFNSFPIRYYESGTRRVAHPDAMPPVKIPKLVTPALQRRAHS